MFGLRTNCEVYSYFRQIRDKRLCSITKMLLMIIAFCTPTLFFSATAYAEAKASSITLTVSPELPLSLSMLPSPSGAFAETGNKTINVQTDNFSGYTLKISSQSSTSLTAVEAENDDAIDSITVALSESDFRNNANYNNKFGYKPSKIENSGVIVANNNFLPIPSTSGDIIDITNTANSTNNSYTVSFGVKIDYSLTPGDYSYTYIISAIGNDSVYNIQYDQNTTDAVTGMPFPNPQVLTIVAGTSAEDSYGVLSNNTPIRANYTFGGWCDVQPTFNTMMNDEECGGITYQPGDRYEVDQTADGTNITLYAIWLDGEFPAVWSQTGKCVFHGDGSGSGTGDEAYLITGSECAKYHDKRFIDTGIALYSNTNYQKDYEVHFTINAYDLSAQVETQATLFNDKLSSSVTESPYGGKSPGIVVRENSSHGLEIKSTYGAPTDHAEVRYVTKTPYATAYTGTDVRIFRISGHIYTSVDNGPLIELQDITSFDQQFGLSAWFGAYPDNVDCTENCTAAKRYLTGELSNLYIKLGDFPADGIHVITFDANGGTPSTTEYNILDGNSLGELPAVTQSGWFFDDWYTAQSGGQTISSSTVPTTTTTYYAHWYKSVTDAQITNTSFSLFINDSETIAISNASDIEPYTLASSDTSVATVDSSGVITAVASGTATITMTGTKTGDTRTITVTVGSMINVDFDSQGGTPATYREPVANGGSFSSLPEPTKSGFTLDGWYTGTNGTGTKLTTSTVFDTNTPTQYYANWTQTVYVCKIATTRHSEQCSRSSRGCRNAGWGANATIDYGYLITDSSIVTAGAAYDCDVDYDGTYDPDTERFYYFGTENGNAKLVYYKNMANENSANPSLAYTDAIALLPNYELDTQHPYVPVWDNPNLVRHTTGDYAGKAARFMTYPEITNGLYSGGNNHITPSDPASTYLFEQSNFTVTTRTDGIWLEQQTDGQGNITYVNRIQTMGLSINHGAVGTTSANAARPTIEVPTQYMEPNGSSIHTQATVTFDSMGGSAVAQATVDIGSALDTNYPSTNPTKTNNKFFGWYTDATFSTEVTPETIVNDDVTYYARWIGDTTNFPIVFSEIDECTFNYTSNISGTYCPSELKSKSYIDTNIKLFSATGQDVNDQVANFDKDFEVGFTIVEFISTDQTGQASVVNSKLESQADGYPGFVFRKNNSNLYQLTAKFSGSTHNASPSEDINFNTSIPEGNLKQVRIVRRNNIMYYAVNGGTLTRWWDLTGFNKKFDTEVWFGAIDTGNGTPDRQIVGKLTDMYIRLGTYEEEGTYKIQFDANGGAITSGDAVAYINQGDQIGSFPTVTRGVYTLVGWYDENDNVVTTATIPDQDHTYHAVWTVNSSRTPVSFDVANTALSGYQTIVNGYQPQITTFNEADPINNSTWGVAKNTYLNALKTNFESNNCMAAPGEDSQIDWGGNHTVNCSKPNAYDTGVSTGVTVYEYDVANDVVSQQPITYAKSDNGLIHNLIPGKNYYWEDSTDSTVYGVVSATSSASNRRPIDVGDIWNARDLGGLPVDTDGDGTADGTIVYGKLIRGGRLNTTSSNITELQDLGIDKEYNLAGATELNPDVKFSSGSYVNDEVIHYQFDYGTIVDNEDTYAMARQAVTDIMNDVISGNNVYFHCRVGADRTGTVAYILEGLLGVPDEQRYQDYEITSVSGLNDRTRYYAQKSSTNNKKFLFMMGYLKTNADILAWYLKDTSDTGAQARITAFRNAMVTSSTPASPNNSQQSLNNTQQLFAGNNSILTNNTNTANTANANVDDATLENESEESYSDPLGVSRTSDGGNNTIATAATNPTDYSAVVGTAIAAASLITLGGTAYSLAKQNNSD